MRARHLLTIEELGETGLRTLLGLTDTFVEVAGREIPKVPALRGRSVMSAFFEDSTRTRLSFETAAKRLSADTMTFSAGSSSLSKGESLRDTIETLVAMGVDALVVRHRSSGAPATIARWLDEHTGGKVSVINAGDGWHAHPTQALLDAYTVAEARGGAGSTAEVDLSGCRVTIVGDVRHSRVARSGVIAFTLLGAQVTLVAPPTLMPVAVDTWPVQVSHDLDAVLDETDVLYLLRLQTERMEDGLLPSVRDYGLGYALDERRAHCLSPDTLIMHPGPVNRGVEVASELSRLPGVLVNRQVAVGVAARMAVLFWALAADGRSRLGTTPETLEGVING